MNDPWDVKSVRQLGQYVSCMKINGVPLLPPVLSKECRKEMQYYKLLAKEIEKRISQLKPFAPESDSDSVDDKTDVSDIYESEKSYELPPEKVKAGFNVSIDRITAITTEKFLEKCRTESQKVKDAANLCENVIASNNLTDHKKNNDPCIEDTQKFIIDVSLNINENGRNVLDNVSLNSQNDISPNELPERDYDCQTNKNNSKAPNEIQTLGEADEKLVDVMNFSFSVNNNVLNTSNTYSDSYACPDELFGSHSIKSFTGSLNDLHINASKDTHKLIRQRSYTVLNPSPQLLAHLEVQAVHTGVELNSISMSESLCNLSLPLKKRRSWDLESAKEKWSSMAIELNQKKGVSKLKINNATRNLVSKLVPHKSSPLRTKSLSMRKTKASSVSNSIINSEPVTKIRRSYSPLKNVPSNKTIVKEPAAPKSPKTTKHKKHEVNTEKNSPVPIKNTDDPASCVRDLYDRIQKQQLKQMSLLMEKQKREQLMLQQVFEEQNKLLFNQLKTITPKPQVEVKEAWGDKPEVATDRGPVSLSQLINAKTAEENMYHSPGSSTLTNTNNYINHCDNVLKRSRDITSSLKSRNTQTQSPTIRNSPPKSHAQPDASRTRTNSPARNPAVSRKLKYDSSASEDRDYEPILTDRTNDTFADLNVTFPSDQSDCINYNVSSKDHKMYSASLNPQRNYTDNAIKNMEDTIHKSIKNMCITSAKRNLYEQPTPQEVSAATTIAAYVRGHQVRRLMRTERVQRTVQTIRDALLCALQLHRERAGIRGADVDLHRRLIQQITAACYSLHDTFVASSPAERCAVLAAERARRRALAARPAPPAAEPAHPHQHPRRTPRPTDVMSHSYSGAFPPPAPAPHPRAKRPAPATLMTQSNYETFSGEPCPRRRPWR